MKIQTLALFLFFGIVITVEVSLAAEPESYDDLTNRNTQGISEQKKNTQGTPSLAEQRSCPLLENDDLCNVQVPWETYFREHGSSIIFFFDVLKETPTEVHRMMIGNITDADAILQNLTPLVENEIDTFLKTTLKTKDKLQLVLPRLNEGEENLFKDQYMAFDGLRWLYTNKRLVEEADGILKNMSWLSTEKPGEEVTNVRMYHELKDNIDKLKESLEKLDEGVSVAKQLETRLNDSLNFVSQSPLGGSHAISADVLRSAFEHMRLLKDHIKVRRRSGNVWFSIDFHAAVIGALKELLKSVDAHLNMLIQLVELQFQNMQLKHEELLDAMITSYYLHFFKAFYSNVEKVERSTEAKSFSGVLKNIIKVRKETLGNLEISFKKTMALLYPEIKDSKFGKFSLDELSSIKDGKGLIECEDVVRNIFRIRSLEGFKQRINILLSLLQSGVKEATETDESTGISRVYCTMGKMGADEAVTALEHLTKLMEGVLTAYMSERKLATLYQRHEDIHAAVRMLQFHWGSANERCKLMQKYDKESTDADDDFKYIALNLQNSVIAIQRILEKYRQESL